MRNFKLIKINDSMKMGDLQIIKFELLRRGEQGYSVASRTIPPFNVEQHEGEGMGCERHITRKQLGTDLIDLLPPQHLYVLG